MGRQRPTEAVKLFRAAQAAAKECEHFLESARWKLSEASALRAQGDLEGTRTAIREAEDIIRPQQEGPLAFLGSVNLFEPNQVSIVAELEGQIGLTHLTAIRHGSQSSFGNQQPQEVCQYRSPNGHMLHAGLPPRRRRSAT